MKWKDLSLKERKQIYDSVRVNNPGATSKKKTNKPR